MKNKAKRFTEIKEIIQSSEVRNQEELLSLLVKRGYNVTQATLSRDLKQLKVAKISNATGDYVYRLSQQGRHSGADLGRSVAFMTPNVRVSIQFSGNIAVLHTRAGYASGLAYEIDEKAANVIIGTVAGEDTIIAVLKENASVQETMQALSTFIPMLEY